MKRSLRRFTFALLFLAILAFSSSLASADVITYDYDNAGQVKKATYAAGTTVAAMSTSKAEFNKCQEGLTLCL